MAGSMSNLKLMHAKLHRFTVTGANLDYVGSITVDSALMEAVGMLPFEEVDVINLDNGNRWSTYLLPGPAGSGVITPNGGGALLAAPGHLLIIYAYALELREMVMARGHEARVAIGGAGNTISELRIQRLVPRDGGVDFDPGLAEDATAPSDATQAHFRGGR